VSINIIILLLSYHTGLRVVLLLSLVFLFLGATAAAAAAAVADQTTRRPTVRGGTHATHTRLAVSSSRAAIQYRQSFGRGRFFARALSYPSSSYSTRRRHLPTRVRRRWCIYYCIQCNIPTSTAIGHCSSLVFN